MLLCLRAGLVGTYNFSYLFLLEIYRETPKPIFIKGKKLLYIKIVPIIFINPFRHIFREKIFNIELNACVQNKMLFVISKIRFSDNLLEISDQR